MNNPSKENPDDRPQPPQRMNSEERSNEEPCAWRNETASHACERVALLARIAAQKAARIEERRALAAALARIAAVEAELEREKLRRIDVSNTLWSHIGELHQDLALARDRMSLHVMPRGDAVTHESNPECICGPDLDVTEVGGLWVHHSIDGREQGE